VGAYVQGPRVFAVVIIDVSTVERWSVGGLSTASPEGAANVAVCKLSSEENRVVEPKKSIDCRRCGWRSFLRRLDEPAEILVLEKGPSPSFVNCGSPYYIGDIIAEWILEK